jgi:hypothetical protein
LDLGLRHSTDGGTFDYPQFSKCEGSRSTPSQLLLRFPSLSPRTLSFVLADRPRASHERCAKRPPDPPGRATEEQLSSHLPTASLPSQLLVVRAISGRSVGLPSRPSPLLTSPRCHPALSRPAVAGRAAGCSFLVSGGSGVFVVVKGCALAVFVACPCLVCVHCTSAASDKHRQGSSGCCVSSCVTCQRFQKPLASNDVQPLHRSALVY